MQRVGFQRFARSFRRRRGRARVRGRNRPRSKTTITRERPERRVDRMAVTAEQPLQRLPDHDAGQHEQQRGLGERRDALDLAVTVVMFLVGRLAGNAHREIGHHGGDEIEQRVCRFRQDRERAGTTRRRSPWRSSALPTRPSTSVRPFPFPAAFLSPRRDR